MQNAIKSKLQGITAKVDPAIYEILSLYVDEKRSEIVEHQIECGGKRLRPALAFLCSEMLGGKEENVLYPAASLEILHNSTLIIDDIIDHSDTRRGDLTVWKKYGTSMAECFSMDYVASVFQGAVRSSYPKELTELFAKTLKTIVDGEVYDILFERSGREEEPFIVKNRYQNITEEDYSKMIEKKTAILMQSSCQAGGICAGASDTELKILGDYGFNIGIAFQLRDDILDIFGDEKSFGKKIGKDIIEKKLGNIVIILALEEINQSDKDKVLSILNSSDEPTQSEINATIDMLETTKAKEKASKLAEDYIEKALVSLGKLPANEANQALKSLAEFIIQRNH